MSHDTSLITGKRHGHHFSHDGIPGGHLGPSIRLNSRLWDHRVAHSFQIGRVFFQSSQTGLQLPTPVRCWSSRTRSAAEMRPSRAAISPMTESSTLRRNPNSGSTSPSSPVLGRCLRTAVHTAHRGRVQMGFDFRTVVLGRLRCHCSPPGRAVSFASDVSAMTWSILAAGMVASSPSTCRAWHTIGPNNPHCGG